MFLLFQGHMIRFMFGNLMSPYFDGFGGISYKPTKMWFSEMKCFIARIKSFLRVEYSWKEFNIQKEENVMKNLNVGNTVSLFLVQVDTFEVKDCSVQCIQILTSYLQKGFLACLL